MIRCVYLVIFDHNGQHFMAGRMETGLHGYHSARDGCVDGGADPLTVPDLLSQPDWITYPNNRCTGCANVLNHGQNDLRR